MRSRYALFLEPTDFKMHYTLAGALVEQHRLEEAEAAFHGSLSTGKRDHRGHNTRNTGPAQGKLMGRNMRDDRRDRQHPLPHPPRWSSRAHSPSS